MVTVIVAIMNEIVLFMFIDVINYFEDNVEHDETTVKIMLMRRRRRRRRRKQWKMTITVTMTTIMTRRRGKYHLSRSYQLLHP